MTNKKSIITLIFSASVFLVSAQTNQTFPKPEVGKPMPDFTLNNITHYKTSKASLKDFKGKWLFLDFWFTGCINCISSFPKINGFHKEFKDKAVFMLVGMNDTKNNSRIRELYEKFTRKQGLEMPAAYDSILVEHWDIGSMPHIIIIDPQGTVRSITGGRDMTADKIKDLFAGKNVSFYPKDSPDRTEFDAEKLSGSENSEGEGQILYRSLLTKWNGELQNAGYDIYEYPKFPKEVIAHGYSVAMVPLYALYSIAYFGRWSWIPSDSLYGTVWPLPIMEVKDSSLFDYDFGMNVGRGTYNYNLTIPISEVTRQNIMRLMQEDLKRYFKYEVSMEKREMPVWKLIAKPDAIKKLKTQGGEKYFSDESRSKGAAGFTARNVPMKRVLNVLDRYLTREINDVFFDETGITENIDITIDAIMTDKDEVKKALQNVGLDLVRATREMTVLVIKDSGVSSKGKNVQ